MGIPWNAENKGIGREMTILVVSVEQTGDKQVKVTWNNCRREDATDLEVYAANKLETMGLESFKEVAKNIKELYSFQEGPGAQC
jgi:hypothetical protein